MTDRIVVEGIRGTGYHGVFEHERRDGQQFLVDVAIELDLRRPGRSDDLVDTVNYGEVTAQVLARIEGEPFDLIEALAEIIAADVLSHDGVDAVDVVVHKPQAPVGVPVTDVRVEIRRERGTRVVIALGSNMGDRVGTLSDAVEQLAEVPRLALTAVSGLIESDPFGGPDQSAYLNGVVLASFAGSPATLLRALHAIEHRNGRTREIRWGARTLDLDLVQFGVPGSDRERLSDSPALLLPHPRAHERNFVLRPWLQLDAEATLRLGPTVADPIRRVADVLAELGLTGVRPGPSWSPAW
jgi:dihydroneopterin aldolase/2-amino-4-hydroxy-6-hydroxymethyldihydropteridine diphosphokinase